VDIENKHGEGRWDSRWAFGWIQVPHTSGSCQSTWGCDIDHAAAGQCWHNTRSPGRRGATTAGLGQDSRMEASLCSSSTGVCIVIFTGTINTPSNVR
jgi:hypothetical protein